MKKQPSLRNVVTIITAILVTSIAYARPKSINHIHDHHALYTIDTSASFEATVETSNLMLNNINMHAMRDFINRFKEVSNEKWYGIEGGFVAKFKTGNMVTMVTYRKNGEWLYTINSFDQELMPQEVRLLVKQTYSNYDILHVKEIEVPKQDSPIFLVYIQNTTTIKILRVQDGQTELLHDYTRG